MSDSPSFRTPNGYDMHLEPTAVCLCKVVLTIFGHPSIEASKSSLVQKFGRATDSDDVSLSFLLPFFISLFHDVLVFSVCPSTRKGAAFPLHSLCDVCKNLFL